MFGVSRKIFFCVSIFFISFSLAGMEKRNQIAINAKVYECCELKIVYNTAQNINRTTFRMPKTEPRFNYHVTLNGFFDKQMTIHKFISYVEEQCNFVHKNVYITYKNDQEYIRYNPIFLLHNCTLDQLKLPNSVKLKLYVTHYGRKSKALINCSEFKQ